MDRILSPGERGNEKRRPEYSQPAKGIDRDPDTSNNRSSRKLDEGGGRQLVSLSMIGQVGLDSDGKERELKASNNLAALPTSAGTPTAY